MDDKPAGKFARLSHKKFEDQVVILSNGDRFDLEISSTKDILQAINAAHDDDVAEAVQKAVESCRKKDRAKWEREAAVNVVQSIVEIMDEGGDVHEVFEFFEGEEKSARAREEKP